MKNQKSQRKKAIYQIYVWNIWKENDQLVAEIHNKYGLKI